MKMLRKVVAASMAAGLLAAASTAHAAPVSINISAASVAGGSGYGIDNGENGGTLLGVQFTSAFSAQELLFTQVGDRFTFDLARVVFSETDAGNGSNDGIRKQETDDLGVTATFTFANPANTVVKLLGTGTATEGLVDDSAVDYVLAWSPVDVDFGTGGRFKLSLETLSFSARDTQTARATVELLAAPDPGIQAVPEPTSLALVGIALAGVAAARRRRSA